MSDYIEKSGTGIEKSGTGIGKSGTGVRFGRSALVLAAAAGLLMTSLATAADSRLFVSERNDGLLVSMHGSDGVVAGFAPSSDGVDGYFAVPLYSLMKFIDSQPVTAPLVVGSGSGASGEVVGSGSGASSEVVGSGSGASGEQCILDPSVMVVGSGSGSSGTVVGSGSGKEVVGSGSGSSSEVVGSGSGSSSEVVGSGSGASGESRSSCGAAGVWGYAEVLVDSSGVHVIVHEYVNGYFVEQLVGLLDSVRAQPSGVSDHDFIAVPWISERHR